ncbi:MAG: hypothetical protein ACI4JK_02240 [Oscillospiraceae bacterium]
MPKSIIDNLSKINIGRQEMINNGFSAQKYDDILRGKSSYKLSDIISISEKFQLSLDYLVYGKEKSSKLELDEKQQRCLNAFNNLSPDDKIEFIARMEQRYEDYSPEKKESVS